MTTKEALLNVLLTSKTAQSGQALASALGVSRTAVWKAAKGLADAGVPVAATTQKGYYLNEGDFSYLHETRIASYLSEDAKHIYSITVEDELPSTNTAMKALALDGKEAFSVLLARRQTAGRGRLGRSFFSPDTGLYMSVLFRPSALPIGEALSLTTMAAVAVSEALGDFCADADIRIKWVNDLYLGDKKICGILTEAATDLETGCLSYAVLGIGINLLPPLNDFPLEIRDVAGALCARKEGQTVDGNRIAALILDRLYAYYSLLSYKNGMAMLREKYRKRSLLDGRRVLVCKKASLGGEEVPATALFVDENMGLRVRYDDGNEETLTSGEVQMTSVHLAGGEKHS